MPISTSPPPQFGLGGHKGLCSLVLGNSNVLLGVVVVPPYLLELHLSQDPAKRRERGSCCKWSALAVLLTTHTCKISCRITVTLTQLVSVTDMKTVTAVYCYAALLFTQLQPHSRLGKRLDYYQRLEGRYIYILGIDIIPPHIIATIFTTVLG